MELINFIGAVSAVVFFGLATIIHVILEKNKEIINNKEWEKEGKTLIMSCLLLGLMMIAIAFL